MQGVPVISCLTDQNGNFVKDNYNSMPFSQLAFNKLNIDYNQKVLLANILDKNYTVCKLPIKLDSINFILWILEEWRLICNLNNKTLSKPITIYPHLKKQNNFTDFEQEIMYSLLSGYTYDKEISIFLCNTTKESLKGNVKYGISTLYEKFHCDNRTDLVYSLKAHELDSWLPKSIFPAGEYYIR